MLRLATGSNWLCGRICLKFMLLSILLVSVLLWAMLLRIFIWFCWLPVCKQAALTEEHTEKPPVPSHTRKPVRQIGSTPPDHSSSCSWRFQDIEWGKLFRLPSVTNLLGVTGFGKRLAFSKSLFTHHYVLIHAESALLMEIWQRLNRVDNSTINCDLKSSNAHPPIYSVHRTFGFLDFRSSLICWFSLKGTGFTSETILIMAEIVSEILIENLQKCTKKFKLYSVLKLS